MGISLILFFTIKGAGITSTHFVRLVLKSPTGMQKLWLLIHTFTASLALPPAYFFILMYVLLFLHSATHFFFVLYCYFPSHPLDPFLIFSPAGFTIIISFHCVPYSSWFPLIKMTIKFWVFLY